MHSTSYVINGINNQGMTLVLSHGLHSSINSPFMEHITDGLAAHGFRVIRFEFPFMVESRMNNTPVYVENTAVLEDYWCKVIKELGHAEKLVIGGKSLSVFSASRVADRMGVRGVVGLEFPFISPDPDLLLDYGHLKTLKTPALIIQGTEDPLGGFSQVDDSVFSHTTSLHWLKNTGHNFMPGKNSSKTMDENILDAVEIIAEFLEFLQE